MALASSVWRQDVANVMIKESAWNAMTEYRSQVASNAVAMKDNTIQKWVAKVVNNVQQTVYNAQMEYHVTSVCQSTNLARLNVYYVDHP